MENFRFFVVFGGKFRSFSFEKQQLSLHSWCLVERFQHPNAQYLSKN